jgi:hypothetical protein
MPQNYKKIVALQHFYKKIVTLWKIALLKQVVTPFDIEHQVIYSRHGVPIVTDYYRHPKPRKRKREQGKFSAIGEGIRAVLDNVLDF